MSLVSQIVGAATVPAIDALGGLFDKLFTSDEEKANAAAVMEKLRQHPGELQVELNKIEAMHRTLFVAGWRPFIGWVCGIGLAFAFLINPIWQWQTGQPGPELPTDVLMELVMGMLGLATLRTWEKVQGRAK